MRFTTRLLALLALCSIPGALQAQSPAASPPTVSGDTLGLYTMVTGTSPREVYGSLPATARRDL